ncbi:MAG: hypothetical protein FWH29_02320 [Methanobrevibacter sp.]|nr:hypothetical protein [Methanobrevibacter sp.]
MGIFDKKEASKEEKFIKSLLDVDAYHNPPKNELLSIFEEGGSFEDIRDKFFDLFLKNYRKYWGELLKRKK